MQESQVNTYSVDLKFPPYAKQLEQHSAVSSKLVEQATGNMVLTLYVAYLKNNGE